MIYDWITAQECAELIQLSNPQQVTFHDGCYIPTEVTLYIVRNKSIQSVGCTAMESHNYANCQTYVVKRALDEIP
jgi:hypothetical protein